MLTQNIYCFITLAMVLLHGDQICAQNLVQNNSNYNELLETIGIFYYSPFYHEEQLVRRSVKLDGFIDDVPIKVLIHGYIASRYHSSIEPIKKAYLNAGNVNLMIVDWSQASYQMYEVSRKLTSQVALRIAQILDSFLQSNNIDSGLVHVIGHSLGAHIAGNVGRSMKSRVGRITGLDPAAPLYLKWSYDALRITDGPFVDVIHTNGERLGESWARGHADFYPNFGIVSQPGCEQKDVLTLFACSHFRSVDYYAESILNPNGFIAVPCPITDILLQRHCFGTLDSSSSVIMGEYTPRETRGTYFLLTNNVSPYGKGNYTELYA